MTRTNEFNLGRIDSIGEACERNPDWKIAQEKLSKKANSFLVNRIPSKQEFVHDISRNEHIWKVNRGIDVANLSIGQDFINSFGKEKASFKVYGNYEEYRLKFATSEEIWQILHGRRFYMIYFFFILIIIGISCIFFPEIMLFFITFFF